MSKLTVTKRFTFDCAHMLTGHEGLCQNLHGHTYLLDVTVSHKHGKIKDGPSAQMVIDFKTLKDIVNSLIVNKFDHSLVVDKTNDVGVVGAEGHFAEVGRLFNLRLVEFPGRPTAENMAEFFFDIVVGAFDKTDIVVEGIRVWETATSYAEVTR